MRVRIFLRLYIFVCLSPLLLFAEHTQPADGTAAALSRLPDGFYSYTLENGLELYVQEDFTVPVVYIDYVTRAGILRQNPDTAGFYRLYSRLFWQNEIPGIGAYMQVGAENFTAECTSAQSRYSFYTPVQSFEKTIALFANSLKHPVFSDTAIQSESAALKRESEAWAKSAGGFINTTVNNTVFAYAPWKKDSNVYPALFVQQDTESIRAVLSYIRRNWYVPNQSALFISGPITADHILHTVKKELADWECGFVQSTASRTRERNGQTGARFVLVSDDFSKELTQLLVQYTAPLPSESPADFYSSSDTEQAHESFAPKEEREKPFSAAAWAAVHILQSRQTAESVNSTDISFTEDGADSRINIQALFPVTSKKHSPVAAAEELIQKTVQALQNSTESDIANAKKHIRFLQQQAFTGPVPFIQALSKNWAYGGIAYFFNRPLAVENLNVTDIRNILSSPWIFLFVHTSQYNAHKKEFEKNGWQLIRHKKTPAFPSYAKRDSKEEQYAGTSEKSTAAENYVQYTKNLMSSFTLSSGIPLTVQKLPNTEWTVCMLHIKGGELRHGFSSRGLEGIALLNLARFVEGELHSLYTNNLLVSLPEVSSNAYFFSSTVCVSCAVQDTQMVFKTLAAALQNKNIKPAAADELYFAEAYKHRIANASLDNQLTAEALRHFFANTDAAPFFKSETEELMRFTYENIRSACLSIGDAETLGVIICGGVPSDIFTIAENSFGASVFSAENPSNEKAAVQDIYLVPELNHEEHTVQLHHRFFTDISAEQAGERPAKLIPTTDFSDPARLYVRAPVWGSEDEPLFAALIYDIAGRMTRQFKTDPKSPAKSVSAYSNSENLSLADFHFFAVKYKNGIKKAFAAAKAELAAELDNSATSSSFIADLKNRYIPQAFFTFNVLERRAELIRKGIEYADNPAAYIDRFSVLAAADKTQLQRVFKTYLQNVPLFWVFSADTPAK